MPRRIRGLISITLGCVLLLTALGWYIYNVTEDKNAGVVAAEILNKMEDATKSLDNNSSNNGTDKDTIPIIMVDGNAFCGKVLIDALAVELPVYEQWSYEKLKTAPCRYTGSVATNDIIIAAHNYKSHFGTLNKLKIGDEIKFVDAYGTVFCYEVKELTTLDGTAVSDMRSGGWDFTLFTCTKSGEQRVTIRCIKK